jgi:hypothetical protein
MTLLFSANASREEKSLGSSRVVDVPARQSPLAGKFAKNGIWQMINGSSQVGGQCGNLPHCGEPGLSAGVPGRAAVMVWGTSLAFPSSSQG